MARYRLVWMELARAHHASLPLQPREQVDVRLEQLLQNPTPTDAG